MDFTVPLDLSEALCGKIVKMSVQKWTWLEYGKGQHTLVFNHLRMSRVSDPSSCCPPL